MGQPPPLPQQPPPPRKSLFTMRRVIGVVVVLVVVRGCFWGGNKNDEEVNPLIGKWQKTGGENDGTTAEFTAGGKLVLAYKSKYSSRLQSSINLYTRKSNRLDVRPEGDGMAEGVTVEFEFIGEDELLFAVTKEEWDANFFLKNMGGRWRRVGVANSAGDTASLENAARSAAIQTQINDLRQRRASLQELIVKALAEKSGLVAQLKQAGVNNSSDLKVNPAARQIAQNLVRLTGEIQSLQRDALRLDEAIGKAESLVRRIEQSQVAVSSDEFAALTGELLTAAETHDGFAGNALLDPISLEAILDESLASSPPVASVSGKAGQLVGKWKITTGRAKGGILELNPKGSAVFTYINIAENEETILGNWLWQGGLLELLEPRPLETKKCRLEIEFLSADEIVAINKDHPYGGFGPVSGKLERMK